MKQLFKTVILALFFAFITQVVTAKDDHKSEVPLSSSPEHSSSSSVKPSRSPVRLDLPFIVYYNQYNNTLEFSSTESVVLEVAIMDNDNNQMILSSLLSVDDENDCVLNLSSLEDGSYTINILYEGFELFGSIMVY